MNFLPTPLLTEVERHLANARERDPVRWERLLSQRAVADSVRRVWACSDFVAASCVRHPQMLEQLVNDDLLESDRACVGEELERVAPDADETVLMEALRRFRQLQMVRIAWRDIQGWATLDQTLTELSDLADVCISFAYRRMYDALTARYGIPRGAGSSEQQPLMILAMGKLGGRELNFSSDIDLILLFPEDGQTDGSRPVDNSEFFLRLGQKVVQLLATPTAEGFVYRVDLRLRPFGESGPLAMSFAAFEIYLQQHGRDWERYAYVKARAITAAEHFASLYDEMLRPFVYRRYLDYGVFESLRDMKAMIAREVERRELQHHVKLGPGGIREIEFIVQAFQLLRGGSDPRLQSPELRTVLPLLAGQRLLGPDAVAELQAAYRYLRVVENRLQQWKDEQTHQLPEDEVGQCRLAYAMTASGWSEFVQILEAHRRNVTRHFVQTVFGPTEKASDRPASFSFDLNALPEERDCALRDLGFADAQGVASELQQLQGSVYYRRLDETGHRRLRDLLPRMLRVVAQSTTPALVLRRLTKILEMIGGRTVYLALLNENTAALQRLVSLCGQSQFLADQIAAHPLLLDELVDERLVEEAPSRAQFAADLAARHDAMQSEDPERQVELLRQFQRAAVFRVAVADLTGRLPLMKVSDRLTDIAELIVGEALALAWMQITARHGEPRCVDADGLSRRAEMIVVAYGKLGGLELGYSSDLDLVFLHNSTGEVQRTEGAQSIDNSVFFQRLGQRLVHLLTVHTSAGRLYEVDTRLRPGGNRGLLVQTLAGFKDYEFQEAWTWEHQSLLRARAIAGNTAMTAEFESARIEVLRKAVRRADLKEEVSKMRARMRENLSRAKGGQFDLKQDAGGIADLEFLVQFWMLQWADRYPEIVIFSDNIRQLESLASGDLVPQERVDFLVNTYRKYRERLHHLSLDGAGDLIDAHDFAAERSGVIAIWEEVLGSTGPGSAPD